MSYDDWKCTPPLDEEPDLEACGHRVGTCEGECMVEEDEMAEVTEYSSEDATIDGWKCTRCSDGNAWADRGSVTIELGGHGLNWSEQSHGYMGSSGSGSVPMSVLRWMMRLEDK